MANDKLYLIGKSGSVIGANKFDQFLKLTDLENDKKLLKLFDFYNTNKESKSTDLLDKEELTQMLNDLLISAGDDNIFEPAEIKKYLSDSGLDKFASMNDILGFLNKILVNDSVTEINGDISGLGTSASIKSNLKDISSENITDVLKVYKKTHNISLIQDIADESGSLGSTRDNYIKIIRNKLIERATQVGVDSSEFILSFDKELKTMDMTLLSGSDTTKLDEVVNRFIEKLIQKEKIYNGNKNGILSMMTDSDLCRTNEDKNGLFEQIMNLSSKYNPKEYLENIVKNSKTKSIKNAANKLLKSGFLDYYPIYVASIIAQESQFREFDDEIFTKNGQGLMQLTGRLLNDMYGRPGAFDREFMDELMEEYPDSTDLYNAIQDREDSTLNMTVGLVGLNGKLDSILKRIKTGYYEKNFGIKPDSPEDILELMAMEYNANDNKKRDKKYSNKMSQVRYVYARDVIQRFKQYTPSHVKLKHYFEYNPNNGKFINK